MKLFSAEQIRRADAYTIRNEPISSKALMERASGVFTRWFCHQFDKAQKILIFAGPGNNGGDGLAIGRMLYSKGYSVQIILLSPQDKLSADCKHNFDLLKAIELPVSIINHSDISFTEVTNIHVGIDALFGTGLTRPVSGWIGRWIEWFNQLPITRVSVDIPSGLFSDLPSEGNIVKANATFSFETPKRALLMPENDKYTGKMHIGKIGLSAAFFADEPCDWHFTNLHAVKQMYKSRETFSHKGHFGRALLIAGSKGKTGAALLAAAACIRSGAGLTTLAGHSTMENALNMYLPEAMFQHLEQNSPFAEWWEQADFDVIGTGPGLSTSPFAKAVFESALKHTKAPMVIDADAINLLGAHRDLWQAVPQNSILTPHPGEFKRLSRNTNSRWEQIELAQKLAIDRHVYIVLKGAYTCIAAPDGNLFFNSTGNAGMAKGGSGDVLTGILTGLLSQGYSPEHAARLGVWLHGYAADIALESQSVESLTAGDIIDNLGKAYKTLQ
jgi:ADP-dependent NAD(P)H-hydrate dehydratase / NAD(P)H-hydrate epimerase